MTDRFYPNKEINNAPISRPVRARVFLWLIAIAVAGTLVSGGFVISARQHFRALEIGYQSEELRRKAIQLKAKKRQLEMERARAASRLELDQQALKLGMERAESGKPDEHKKGGE